MPRTGTRRRLVESITRCSCGLLENCLMCWTELDPCCETASLRALMVNGSDSDHPYAIRECRSELRESVREFGRTPSSCERDHWAALKVVAVHARAMDRYSACANQR